MYALVSADFPNVTPEQRKKIYECLEKNQWHKFQNVGRDITTCWYASFKDTVNYDAILRAAEREFRDCCSSYCNPRLVIHVGQYEPVEIT